jgi:hypothetical protein
MKQQPIIIVRSNESAAHRKYIAAVAGLYLTKRDTLLKNRDHLRYYNN